MDDASALRARHAELCAKIDAFAARVHARYADRMACRAGCDGCCRTRLTVTRLEAEAIRDALAALAPEVRRTLALRAEHASDRRCVLLDDDGRCAAYDARPLVCRSHGLPIRTRSPRGLPVVDACSLNFVEHGPAAVDASCVLDQETLSTISFALDAALARLRGEPANDRVDVAALVAEACRARG